MELAIDDRGRLDELELVINKNMKAFYEIGAALKEIRDSRLYKNVLGYDTFEDYCRERWDMGRRYINYQIGATQVVDNLQDGNHGSQIPSSERQARPLTRLSPPLQIEAWTKVIDTAPDGRVTAIHVMRVVGKMVGDDEKRRFRKVRHKLRNETLISESFKNAFDNLAGEIQDAKFNNWKDTSRDVVMQYLHSLKSIINIGGEKC